MKLKLYHRWGCPLSAQVRSFILENQIDDKVDLILLPDGQGQTPFMIVGDRTLNGSVEVIEWLDKNIVCSPKEMYVQNWILGKLRRQTSNMAYA